MFWNSPRRLVLSSMSGPMYSVGVMTCAATHGSLMTRSRPGSGICAGLSTTSGSARGEQLDSVLDARRRGDEVEVELALEALLDDLHVEEAEEATAEPEAEGHRRLGLVDEAGVVEVELVERVAQLGVVVALQRIDAGEDERQASW